MSNRSLKRILTISLIAGSISGCGNLPPLIQQNGNTYGLYLPSGQQLIDAMSYQEDAQVPWNGSFVVVEHKDANKVRFLYPNKRFVDIDGWSNLRLISATQNNDQTVALFRGDNNGVHNRELMVILDSARVRSVPVADAGDDYRISHIQGDEIDLANIANPDLVRVFSLSSGVLSAPRSLNGPSQDRNPPAPHVAHKLPRMLAPVEGATSRADAARNGDGMIKIKVDGLSVKGRVDSGYQRAAPQRIDLN